MGGRSDGESGAIGESQGKAGVDSFREAAFVHRGGGRYVALVCDNDLFHHADDRWPDAIDAASLAKYARAFATAVAQVAAT